MYTSEPEKLLEIQDLNVSYGKLKALFDVSFDMYPGQIVALLGPNGAGKSTLLRTISRLIAYDSGTIKFLGQEMVKVRPSQAVELGIAHVIEGHRIFTQQTVLDNLLLAGYGLSRVERESRIDFVLSMFPEIASKKKDLGSSLSGGQQQMLAIAQSLVRQPRLLMLDEPSAGLSPVLVDRVLGFAADLSQSGVAVLLVEQLTEKAVSVADKVIGVVSGHVVLNTSSKNPRLPKLLHEIYMGSAINQELGNDDI